MLSNCVGEVMNAIASIIQNSLKKIKILTSVSSDLHNYAKF